MRRLAVLLLVVLAGAVAAGCGLGAGDEQDGGVSVTVSRDFGRERVGSAEKDAFPAGETAMRLLQRSFDVQTRYGGAFVQEIDGVAGGLANGRRVDWFYYVNGIEAGVGANEHRLAAGDRIWWDHHDWSAAMRIPAVVGSFPEPFLSGRGGKKLPVRLDCAPDSERACDEVRLRLEAAGVKGTARQTIGQAPQTGLLRVVVGRWTDVRRDAAARRIDRGPGESGVFARFTPDGRRLELLDARGRPVRALAGGSGLVAATAFAEQAPTWVVTGTDDVGVAAAAGALTEDGLRDHFAVAVERGRGIGLPVRPAGTP